MKTSTIAVAVNDVTASPSVRTLRICLINPRFEPSYWGFENALPVYPGDKGSAMIFGALFTVAGPCGDGDVYLLDVPASRKPQLFAS
jgi:hypothetical protein